jgi:hypothetical protein
MRLKNLVALALIGGLIAGGAVSADAKKKKKKTKKKTVFVATPVTYFLAKPEGGACADVYLSITKGPEGQSSCGNLVWGVPGDAIIAAGGEDQDVQGLNAQNRAYAAADGLPFIIDATKEVTGQVVVNSYATANGMAVGGGAATLEVALVGESGGEEATIGSTEVEYTAQPGAAPPAVEFTLDVDDELNKAEFSSLAIVLRNRGMTVAHGFYSNAGDTFFSLPTFVKKTVKVKK